MQMPSAYSAVTRRILAFKSNIELNGDQVQYLQAKYGKSALENSSNNKGTSAEQLLAYLDSRNDISYICVFNKVESKLLQFNQKGRPTKKQKNCELSKLSKKKTMQIPMRMKEDRLKSPNLLKLNLPFQAKKKFGWMQPRQGRQWS
jgi:hypothetical protein